MTTPSTKPKNTITIDFSLHVEPTRTPARAAPLHTAQAKASERVTFWTYVILVLLAGMELVFALFYPAALIWSMFIVFASVVLWWCLSILNWFIP